MKSETPSTRCEWLRRMSPVRFMIALYALSLIPRLLFVLAAGHADLSLDEIEYHLLARNLAAGNGYRWYFGLLSSFRPPGYPFFLAGVYALFGPSYYAARLVQTFIAAGAPVLTYLLGRRTLNEQAGRVGGLILAAYPPLILYSVGLLTENIFIPLLLSALLFLAKTDDARPRVNSGLAGVCLVAGILVRPEVTYALPLLLVWMVWPGRERQQRVLNTVIILAIVVAGVTPWCIRNARVTGQFVYLDTRSGYNLYIGYREGADGTFNMAAAQELVNEFIQRNMDKLSTSGARLTEGQVRRLLNDELLSYKYPLRSYEELRARYNLDAAESDVVMDTWGRARAKAFMREHPWKALGLIPLKFAHFWNLEHHLFLYAYSWNFIGPLPAPILVAALLALLGPFAALTVLAVVGTVSYFPPGRRPLLILAPILFYTAIHSVTFGEARFHYVIVPFLALLAAQGWEALRARRSVASWTRRRVACLCALLGVFGVVWLFGLWNAREAFGAVLAPNGNQSHLTF